MDEWEGGIAIDVFLMRNGCDCCVPHFVAQSSLHRAADVEEAQEEEGHKYHASPPLSSSSHGDIQERNGPKVIVMSGGMGTFTVCASLLLHAFRHATAGAFAVSSTAATTTTGMEKPHRPPSMTVPSPPSDAGPWRTSSPFLSLVAVPDGVTSEVLQQVADSVERSVQEEMHVCVSSSSFSFSSVPTTDANMPPIPPSWATSVQVLQEGMSTRERALVYERGGFVVGTCRVFCVDILHRRLSPSLIRVTVFLLTRAVGRRSGANHSSPLSLLFPSSSFSGALSGKHARRPLLRSHQEGPRWKRGDMFNFAFLMNILRDPPVSFASTDWSKESSATACAAHGSGAAPPLHTAVAMTAGGEERGRLPPSYVPPKTFFLSDDPIGVQYLAQSHQKGFPRFFTQLAVEEIMLFPRFRLEIMKFYEAKNAAPAPLSIPTTTAPPDRRRRIHVHRILVPPSRATKVIDHLLEKILHEIGVELRDKAARIRRIEEEEEKRRKKNSEASVSPLSFSPHGTSTATSPSSRTSSRFQKRQHLASAMDETVPVRCMPLSTPSFPSSSSSTTTTTTTTASPSSSLNYIRKPWRDAHSPFVIHFEAMTPEMAADVSDWELDEDLSAAVFANARSPAGGGRDATDHTPTSPSSHPHPPHSPEGGTRQSPPPLWPYHALVYSLLDVRQLRRDLHHLTPYDFLWALQCALRLSKKASACLSLPSSSFSSASPTPLWTLSSSFYDLIMAATERVGTVVPMKKEEEETHPPVEPSFPTPSTVSYVFQPHPIHTVDPVQEVLVTMIGSWCRTNAKERHQKRNAKGNLHENPLDARSSSRRRRRDGPGEDDGGKEGHFSTGTSTPVLPSRVEKAEEEQKSPTHPPLPPPVSSVTAGASADHVLLVICFGADVILRTVQRLLYGKTHYHHLLLNRFLVQYQRLHYRPPPPPPPLSAPVVDTTPNAVERAVVSPGSPAAEPCRMEEKKTEEAQGGPASPPPSSSSLARQWRETFWNRDDAPETPIVSQDTSETIQTEEEEDEEAERGRTSSRHAGTGVSARRVPPKKGTTDEKGTTALRHWKTHPPKHKSQTIGKDQEEWEEGEGESDEEEKDEDAYTVERLMEFARLFSQRVGKDEDDDEEEEEENGKQKRKKRKNGPKKKTRTLAPNAKKAGNEEEEEEEEETDATLHRRSTDLPIDSLFSLPSLPESIRPHPSSSSSSVASSPPPPSRVPSLHEILMRQPLAPPPPPPSWFPRSSPSLSLEGIRHQGEAHVVHLPPNGPVMVEDEDASSSSHPHVPTMAMRRREKENEQRKSNGNEKAMATLVMVDDEDDTKDEATKMPSRDDFIQTAGPAENKATAPRSRGVRPTSTTKREDTKKKAAVVVVEEEEDVMIIDHDEAEEEEEEEVVVVVRGAKKKKRDGRTVPLSHLGYPGESKRPPPPPSPMGGSSSAAPHDVQFELREWSASCAVLDAMVGGGGDLSPPPPPGIPTREQKKKKRRRRG